MPSPEFVLEDDDNDDDDDFVKRKRRGKSVKATPSKKLKRAMVKSKRQPHTKSQPSPLSSVPSIPSSPLSQPSPHSFHTKSLSHQSSPLSSLSSSPFSSSRTKSLSHQPSPSSPSSFSPSRTKSLSHQPSPSSSSPSRTKSLSHQPSPSSSSPSRTKSFVQPSHLSSLSPSIPFSSSIPSSHISHQPSPSPSSPLPPPEVEFLSIEETSHWAEVYSAASNKWWCIHTPTCSVDQPELCEKHCLVPLHYVLAFEDGDIARDVTAHYASDWCTGAGKQRVSRAWWEESLRPFQPNSIMETMLENEAIISKLKSQPLPLTISDYKNHPLYVLKRHLLKFEALYPEDSPVLGQCKGEHVYARRDVHTLHTRETWLKDGRVVRGEENAYRVVKARPKMGQSALEASGNVVEVFGRWQTEEYTPPLVVDGKVPRNEYGNVDMFKPSMLPVGGAHIKIPGIQKVARKLGVDSAPAMVGYDFHGGHTHPIFDGVIVAMEMEELLLEAWQTEEHLRLEREVKKREKRVCDRWRKMVRGVLIKERVEEKFKNINS